MLAEPKTTSREATVAPAARAAEKAIASALGAAWGDAHARWKAAVEHAASVASEGDEDQIAEADEAADQALVAMLRTRAPDVRSIAEKGKFAINELLGFGLQSPDANADNPAYVSHLLSRSDYTEEVLISMYQDLAMLSGAPEAIWTARPDHFDPKDWLAALREKGTRYHYVDGGRTRDSVTFEGPGSTEATTAHEGLDEWHREAILLHLRHQAASVARTVARMQSLWDNAVGTGSMIRVFAEMAAFHAEPVDGHRRAGVRRTLRDNMRRDLGLPVGMPDFDPALFVIAAYERGCRFKLTNPLFGPELMRRAQDDSGETADVCARFCQLDGDQVDRLTSYLLARREWAAAWIAELEKTTGCTVTFHRTGLGFGVDPEHEARIDDAALALNSLTAAERAILKDYGQAQDAGDGADTTVRMAA